MCDICGLSDAMGTGIFFCHFLCTSMETFTKIRPPLAVADLGEGSKLRPEGPKKKVFLTTGHSPYLRVWMTVPPPLPLPI